MIVAGETALQKITLNKTIAAKRLSKTGVPLPEPETTIPYGAILEAMERDRSRGTVSFRYLTERYTCPYEALASAADIDDNSPEPAKRPAATAASASGPQLNFEKVACNLGPVSRAKVPGGWLIWTEHGLAFYPDADHRWG